MSQFKLLREHGPVELALPTLESLLAEALPDLPIEHLNQGVFGFVKVQDGALKLMLKASSWEYLSEDELNRVTKCGQAPTIYEVIPDKAE